jgi:hypothetical protein
MSFAIASFAAFGVTAIGSPPPPRVRVNTDSVLAWFNPQYESSIVASVLITFRSRRWETPAPWDPLYTEHKATLKIVSSLPDLSQLTRSYLLLSLGRWIGILFIQANGVN